MRIVTAALTGLILAVAVLSGADGRRDSRTDRQLLGITARPGEELIHTTPGADKPAAPALMPEGQGVPAVIRTVDAQTGKATPARVNLIGADGNYYEPDENRNDLAQYSLHKTGNREGKGPFRYYGWFFYTSGEATVRVPAGKLRVEAWKGFEYEPVRTDTEVVANGDAAKAIVLRMKHSATIEDAGYVSGDTHLHFTRDGMQATEKRLLDLLAAEDIRVGFMLAMNEPSGYSPRMEDQIWPQASYGNNSIRHRRDAGPTGATRRGYTMISSQEYRANTFGHILMLAGDRLVDDEVHRMGGYAFHAHGGYAKGIYGDFAQQKTDGVELLQFAEYRGISLEGWYHILNAGFRFPGIGASDYPYCRALGDCRTYVRIPDDPKRADPRWLVRRWVEGAAAGRSFFTTGPLLDMKVDAHQPGDVVDLPRPTEVTVTLTIESPVVPVTDVELVVGGRMLRHDRLTGTGPWRQQWNLAIREPTWVAARAYSKDAQGRQNAEAHTNPVYYYVNGRRPHSIESLNWLISRIDERISYHAGRDFPQRNKVLAYFRRSREALTARPTGE
jgi:hypothetical protein